MATLGLMNNNFKYECKNCTLEDLIKIRNFIQEMSSSCGVKQKFIDDIKLAVDEAITNLIKYAFNGSNGYIIKVIVNDSKDKIIINIKDNGIPFDPKSVSAPDMKEYFEKMQKGGLGIHIMRSIIDNIEYIPSDKNSNFNTLTLIKNKR